MAAKATRGPRGIRAIRLDETADVSSAAELRETLLAALARGGPLAVDLAQAGRADTAVFQLLLAFAAAARQRGIALEWRGSSAAFEASAELLGVRGALGLPGTST
jgi:anti-anti-sigma regulatory factor